MSKPARPELRFSTFEDMLADVDRLRSGPYDKAGKWDLGMILDHLTKSMDTPFASGGRNMPWPASAIARWVIHRMVTRNKYPNIEFPAPRSIRPAAAVAVEDAYAAFVISAARVKSGTDATIKVPPFGVVPMDDFKKLSLLHGSHHLSFLKSV